MLLVSFRLKLSSHFRSAVHRNVMHVKKNILRFGLSFTETFVGVMNEFNAFPDRAQISELAFRTYLAECSHLLHAIAKPLMHAGTLNEFNAFRDRAQISELAF